jgi:RNA polymerase sigma-70 factor (ECF subfamily)
VNASPTRHATQDVDLEHLVDQLRAGDEAAFETLVRTAGGRMLAVARRMLGQEQDAQDAVQDAFLSAFKSLDRFDGRSQLTTWLHRITVNACLMKMRSTRRRPERSIGSLLPEFRPDGHQAHPSRSWTHLDSEDLERAELLEMVRRKIDELPDASREVLLVRDVEGLSTEEAGSMLGLTVPAVKTRLHRARQALRAMVDEELEASARRTPPQSA